MAQSTNGGTVAANDLETTGCPLCGCERSQPYLKAADLLHHEPGEFRVVRCVDCGHFYLDPRPTPESIGRYYPREYGPYRLCSNEFHDPDDLTSQERRGRLNRFLRSIPGLRAAVLWFIESRAEYIPEVTARERRALEVGCADGRFLEKLRSLGWQAQGVELSPQPAKRAADRGFEVNVGTLERASFPESRFDAVFAWMVVEHLHDPKGTLEEIHRILKPGGWFCFAVPNFGCWEPKVFRRYWHALESPRHLQHFTEASLRRLLGQTGFELVKLIHQRNAFNLVGSAGLWLRENVPRLRLGGRLIRFTDNPSTWGVVALAPLAKLLAWIRQSGRLTVVARRR